MSEVECEVCVLGAGIAGLNALYAVSRHLSAGDKVVLVDRKQAAAGMWRTTYDYVRELGRDLPPLQLKTGSTSQHCFHRIGACSGWPTSYCLASCTRLS